MRNQLYNNSLRLSFALLWVQLNSPYSKLCKTLISTSSNSHWTTATSRKLQCIPVPWNRIHKGRPAILVECESWYSRIQNLFTVDLHEPFSGNSDVTFLCQRDRITRPWIRQGVCVVERGKSGLNHCSSNFSIFPEFLWNCNFSREVTKIRCFNCNANDYIRLGDFLTLKSPLSSAKIGIRPDQTAM